MRKAGLLIAITLTLVAMTWTVSSQQVKRSIGSDALRIPRAAAPADATTLATRQRFLEMFARAYFPGRTGQLLIVPREGDFITRADVAYMHGSPWTYDVAIPLMFAGPAVRAGTYSTPAVQQDVAPTLAAALGVQMPPTTIGRVLPVLRTGFVDHEWSSCSSWMACAGITSIATGRPCQRSPPCASVVPGSLRRGLTFFRPTQPLGTRRSRPEPILAYTKSQGSVCTSARSADATTLSLEERRKT